jgi:hypothetical protein
MTPYQGLNFNCKLFTIYSAGISILIPNRFGRRKTIEDRQKKPRSQKTMDTTISNEAMHEEPVMKPALSPQQRLGRPGVRQPNRKTPDQGKGQGTDQGIDHRLNLHSVHIFALEAMMASLPKQNGINAEQVYAYIDARATDGNSNLGAAAKKVADELLQSAGAVKSSGIQQPMMKRIASWLLAVVAATAIVTAGFVGVAALVFKTGFSG